MTCKDKRGTVAGYSRHRRAGTNPCRACYKAYRAYQQAYNRALLVLARNHRDEFHALLEEEKGNEA